MARSRPSVGAEQPRPDSLGEVDALAQLAFLVQGKLERRAAAHELSIPQVRLLGILRDRAPTMYELSRLLRLDKSSTTGLVDRAERRGLVQRQQSETDRREIHVSLTRQGKRLVSKAAAEFSSDVMDLLAAISPTERTAMLKTVNRLLWSDAQQRGLDPALVFAHR
jgi:DNA-binding MarR family transcriptional regulator